MAWAPASDRKAKVEDLAVKAEARAAERRARAALQTAKGKRDKAAEHVVAALRQEQIASLHRQELARLQIRERRDVGKAEAGAAREAAYRKAQERAKERVVTVTVDPLETYMQALDGKLAVEHEAEQLRDQAREFLRLGEATKAQQKARAALARDMWAKDWQTEADAAIASAGGRDLERERFRALSDQSRLRKAAIKRQAGRADMGIESDERTAAGQREFVAGGKGRDKIASAASYATLIRDPKNRTTIRLEAMRRFDVLCSTAEEGLFPELKMESESKSTGAGSLVMEHRVAGIGEMQDLRRAIGGREVDMLRLWIWERHTLTHLVREGYGHRDTISALTLAAVDAAARFWGVR